MTRHQYLILLKIWDTCFWHKGPHIIIPSGIDKKYGKLHNIFYNELTDTTSGDSGLIPSQGIAFHIIATRYLKPALLKSDSTYVTWPEIFALYINGNHDFWMKGIKHFGFCLLQYRTINRPIRYLLIPDMFKTSNELIPRLGSEWRHTVIWL